MFETLPLGLVTPRLWGQESLERVWPCLRTSVSRCESTSAGLGQRRGVPWASASRGVLGSVQEEPENSFFLIKLPGAGRQCLRLERLLLSSSHSCRSM